MRPFLVTVSLVLLNGCGSCLDEKKPEPTPAEPRKPVYTEGADGAPVLIGEGEGFKGFAKLRKDGGSRGD